MSTAPIGVIGSSLRTIRPLRGFALSTIVTVLQNWTTVARITNSAGRLCRPNIGCSHVLFLQAWFRVSLSVWWCIIFFSIFQFPVFFCENCLHPQYASCHCHYGQIVATHIHTLRALYYFLNTVATWFLYFTSAKSPKRNKQSPLNRRTLSCKQSIFVIIAAGALVLVANAILLLRKWKRHKHFTAACGTQILFLSYFFNFFFTSIILSICRWNRQIAFVATFLLLTFFSLFFLLFSIVYAISQVI